LCLTFFHKIIFLLIFHFFLLTPESYAIQHSRWRGNGYIRDGGILPYQRCHATDFYPGPPQRFQTFGHGGREYRAVSTSASVWGKSAEDGEPIEAFEVEVMSFYTEAGKVCLLPPDAKGIHCSVAIIRPAVMCKVKSSISADEWRRGSVDFVAHDNVMVTPVPLASIHCPLMISDLADKFEVEIVLGDARNDHKETMLIDLCYEHVESEVPIVLCTEGLYGFSLDSTFWGGKPRFPFGSTLLDAFILHNADEIGARIVINVFRDDLQESMHMYSNRSDIVVRPGWELSELTYSGGWYDHEAMAEANCWWENRFRARWFQIISAPDNFILPPCNSSLASLLSRINQSEISEIQVPIVLAYSPSYQSDHQLSNVLQRFSLLGPNIHNGQFTPIGNPRHYSYGMIHWLWNGGRREAKGGLGSHEVVTKFNLRTVHIMALRDDFLQTSNSSKDDCYDSFARILQLKLKGRYVIPDRFVKSANSTTHAYVLSALFTVLYIARSKLYYLKFRFSTRQLFFTFLFTHFIAGVLVD
jgi:hypothetical protein